LDFLNLPAPRAPLVARTFDFMRLRIAESKA
jgi:hypothetical protein